MIKTLVDALKIKEIRQRLLYTFVMMLVIRLGCQLPIPGTNAETIESVLSQFSGGSFGFFDAMTGGSFSSMSVFALNITPYITSSIIMQLLTIAIPKLEELQRDGEDGRKKIAAATRYVTVGLALIESIAMAIGFGNQGLFGTDYNAWNIILAVVTMTAGSAVIMWIGERITENGVGNGISIVLTINILSRMPSDIINLFDKFVVNAANIGMGAVGTIIIVAVIIAVIAFVVLLSAAERRIPVQYSKKIQGRKQYGGSSTFIPLRVNTSGVIPIIFASSILQVPVIIARFFVSGTPEWAKYLTDNFWCNLGLANIKYNIGLIAYIVMIVFFAYFYTSITFNPMEVSNNMKQQGGFVAGIRPGKPTTDYLVKILNYVVFIGAVGLVIVSFIPIFFSGVFGASVSFGGTSLIIIVGVILETIKQIESKMVVRNYKGFLSE